MVLSASLKNTKCCMKGHYFMDWGSCWITTRAQICCITGMTLQLSATLNSLCLLSTYRLPSKSVNSWAYHFILPSVPHLSTVHSNIFGHAHSLFQIVLAAQNLPFRLRQPMFAMVHWQQGAKSLVHEGGSGALTCSPLGQGIAGTLTSAVTKWLVVLQLLMFQVGGFPLAFVCSAWLWLIFGGSEVPLCPVRNTSSLQGPWRRWEFPMAGSHSQCHNGNFLLCLIFAWGPYQPFLVPFPKLIYWWWV